MNSSKLLAFCAWKLHFYHREIIQIWTVFNYPRVAFPTFGNPALSLETYNYARNKVFVAAVGMLRKKEITIWKLKSGYSQLLRNHFSRAKIKILARQINVRTLDKVSQLRANYRLTLQFQYGLLEIRHWYVNGQFSDLYHNKLLTAIYLNWQIYDGTSICRLSMVSTTSIHWNRRA